MENEDGVDIELEDTQESTEQDEATENESQDDDTASGQKNKSNWKKMSETNKALKAELSEARAELAKVTEWANSLYEDEDKKPFLKKQEEMSEDKVSKLEKKLFLSENKEAKEYLDKIEEVQTKYGMDLEDAWDFVKAKLPPESKTKKDFELGQKSIQIKKNLQDVTPEEALKLSKEQKREWRKIHGYG